MNQITLQEEIKRKVTGLETPKKINVEDEIINKSFIMKDDLRDWIFKEDKKGNRYRERIWELIEKIGDEEWFKLKGYPINSDSVWKNRYTGSLSKLGEESGLYLLWENNLPIDVWNDKDLFAEYKKGTKEFYEKKEQENADDKKYNRKSKKQTLLFGEKVIPEEKETQEQVIKSDEVCVVCKKKEKSWSCVDEVKHMCDDCKNKHYEEVFKDLNLPNGFKDLGESYKFYSFTTGAEEVRKDRILSVLGGKQSIQTCDEFGCFLNCFGVTEDFCNYLIKELKLVKTIDGEKQQIEFNGVEVHTSWRNQKIKQDETSKKIAELKKELSVQKKEMMEKLKEIRGLEDGKKENKK